MLETLPLTLGTATFGMPYGVSNPQVTPGKATIFSMLDLAWEGGVTFLDTAPGYGLAEERIGEWSRSRQKAPTVITKLPSLGHVPDSEIDTAIRSAIAQSTSALAVSPIAGYLTHDVTDYLRASVRDSLGAAVRDNMIASFGPSVYTSDEVHAVIASGPPDILQLPISVFDQRMVRSGALDACRKSGVRVFARSIFLQGIVFMAPDQLRAELSGLAPAVTAFQKLAHNAGTSVSSLALRFIRDLPGVASVVAGAYSPDQLSELLRAVKSARLDEETGQQVSEISGAIPEELLDPRRWPR